MNRIKQHARRKYCFVISPIGEIRTPARDRADKLLKYIFKPVCKDKGFNTFRADEIQHSGMITRQIIERLLHADLVIADLAGKNPNVYYELAVRHFAGLPTITVSDREELPFDISDVRTIKIDHRDIESVEEAKKQLSEFIDNSTKIRCQENPITETLRSAGISVPLITGGTKSVVEQFQSVAKELLNELREIRRERNIFRDKAINQPNVPLRTQKKTDIFKTAFDLTGEWDSHFGPVKIVQNENDVYGDYPYYAGSFAGKLAGTRVVAKWKENWCEGVACWDIKDSSNLVGRSWWGFTAPKYEELLKNPNLVNKLKYLNSAKWDLTRQQEQKSASASHERKE